MKRILFAFIVLITSSVFSQKIEFATLLIPDSLKQNANAVVRLDQTAIVITSQRSMTIQKKRIITVLNEKGLIAIDAVENYDNKKSVKHIEATVYDALGNEIKRIKRKDFRDQCTLDGITLFSDSRIIYLNYTPVQYPFTVVYECEMVTSNTAFIPPWYPLNRHFVSVEKSVLNVSCPDDLGFKKKEFNFSNFPIKKGIDTSKQLSYEANGIVAQKEEYFSPENYEVFPWVMLGLESFNLEGVDGTAKTWKEFGQWYFDKILSDTNELPEETKAKMLTLVGTEKDPIQKAKIIYNYVQQKSRYVSIQVGIGGFKPMLAKDVDRLGYGDCKALTNYTKALLNAVGVTSYNTILYGDQDKMDIEADFVSIQGNHMILSIPVENKYVWLECTSQDGPFGFQANFTDDRNVLIIKPTGGEIVRTKNYLDKDNQQINKGHYTISENGNFSGVISMVSEGTQYNKYRIENEQPNEKESHFKEYWDNINNLKINKMTFLNDKEKIIFTENLEVSAINYGTVMGNKMLFTVNAFNQYKDNIKRIRNRKTPFEIQRGVYDIDEISVTLPTEYSLETTPKDFELNSKFGEYKTEIIKKDTATLFYKRTFLIRKGEYKNSEYEEYRLFMEQIARNDSAKIILNKN